jgi:UDP-N-acetylmuramoyl-L-alanyl-D-glutamate--2,6-diaminopimelate ligase
LRLSELINGDSTGALPDVEIVGLSADSRDIRPGYLFAALAGTQVDGAKFIDDAIARGAAAVLAARDVTVANDAVVVVNDDDPRHRLAIIAAKFYGRQPNTVAAVTGTNGKSSVVTFLRQIWCRQGYKAASLGTLGVRAPGREEPLVHTTPDPVTIHRVLAELADDGVDHLALEASSHGLDQRRLDGIRIGSAAFTNLSRDHLDYHADTEDYLAAKLRLFHTVMAPQGTVIVFAGSEYCDRVTEVARESGHRVVTYGTPEADIALLDTTTTPEGQKLSLSVFGNPYSVVLPLIGGFQAANALCALGLALAGGCREAESVDALGTLRGVPGRLERVGRHPSGASVYVDYAHKPGALETVLTAVRPHVEGRLLVVFGCGGDRDKGKRPIMGRIARDLADAVIVTDDNPRGEDAATIRREVMAGCPDADEIGDRKSAIRTAVSRLQDGDVLVIAGKGHERGQIVGDKVLPFEDKAVAQAALAALAAEANR